MRTAGLDPLDAPVCGTYQIQRAGGRGTLASSGPNHRGDTDWTEVELVFQAPADGRVRIAPFLVGFGKGTGTAWFDDLRLEAFEPSRAPAVITREFLQSGRIEPGQYGQFIEYLCDLVPGMWADKLCDGGFEGLSPYTLLRYLKETDFREHPWYPLRRHQSRQVRPRHVDHGSAAPARTGSPPRKTSPARSASPRTASRSSKGSPALLDLPEAEGGRGPRASPPASRGGRLRRRPSSGRAASGRSTRLDSSRTATDTWATISIEFHGPGTLWLDSARLMPEDAIGGWRKDVVEAVRAMKPGVIRFGGSAVDVTEAGDFEWRDTIGDPDRRKTLRAWGGLQPAGPGLEEIVQFCRLVDAEPLICVRIVGRTPRDAADQVEYFNGGPDDADGAPCGPGTDIPSRTASSTGRSATSRAGPTTSGDCPTSARR